MVSTATSTSPVPNGIHHSDADPHTNDYRRNSHSWMDALLSEDILDGHVDDVPSTTFFQDVKVQSEDNNDALTFNDVPSASSAAPVAPISVGSTSDTEDQEFDELEQHEDWQHDDFDFDVHVEAFHSPRQSPLPSITGSHNDAAKKSNYASRTAEPAHVVSPEAETFTIGAPVVNSNTNSVNTTTRFDSQTQAQTQAMQMMQTLSLPFPTTTSAQNSCLNNFGVANPSSMMMTMPSVAAASCSFQRVTTFPSGSCSSSSSFDASSIPLVGKPMGLDYVDYADVPEQHQAIPPAERNTGGVQSPFPERLHDMLTANKNPEVVSWAPHGRCFVVRQPRLFETEVLPNYFNQTKYRSFQRQLNLYGFRRITGGPDRGGYYHPLMLRGRRKLCTRMRRLKPVSKGGKGNPFVTNALVDPALEPNFYAMAPVGSYQGNETPAASTQFSSQQQQPHHPSMMCYSASTQVVVSNTMPSTNQDQHQQQQQPPIMTLNLSSASPLTAALYNSNR